MINIEQLRESLEITRTAQAENLDELERWNKARLYVQEAAATLLRVVENMPKDEGGHGSGDYNSGFNACRTEIINLIGVKP